ncbi:Transcription factor [Geosmithia morbida]|uniref:Transcription factor n=1 Tax=Geosmithia morbida TaxID=1094350 RepID=A0A9P5CZD2_9HYPO|nr:Transcription factor [Geosmithia morbida]KAF4120347.1 Transcription factor [Geosmithia morbida]
MGKTLFNSAENNDASSSRSSTRRVGKRGGRTACDQCKFRKIKCSLSNPCTSCERQDLRCTYNTPRRKRAIGKGARILEIKKSQKQSESDESHISPDSRELANSRSPEQGLHRPLPSSACSVSAGNQLLEPPGGFSLQAGTANPPSAAIYMPGVVLESSTHRLAVDDEYWLPNIPPNQHLPCPGNHDDFAFGDDGSTVPWGMYPDSLLEPPWQPHTAEPYQDFPATDEHDEQWEQRQSRQSPVGVPATDARLMVSGAAGGEPSMPPSVWPSSVTEENLLPWIDIFFARLGSTLPVLDQLSCYRRIILKEHRSNPQLASLLLSLSAVSLTQPVWMQERESSSSRRNQANLLMMEAVRLRSTPDFGESPTLDTLLTSFFLFACLYGSNQHNAAWLRLKEAVDIAVTMGLNISEGYDGLREDQKLQRFKIYLILVITERSYALQRDHPIEFATSPLSAPRGVGAGSSAGVSRTRNPAARRKQALPINVETLPDEVKGIMKMYTIYELVDENIAVCWSRQCGVSTGTCHKFDRLCAVSRQSSLRHYMELSKTCDGVPDSPTTRRHRFSTGYNRLQEIQRTDYFVSHRWLATRLWLISLSHGLLEADSEYPELSFGYAMSIAEDAFELCQGFSLDSMEAHGIGLVCYALC